MSAPTVYDGLVGYYRFEGDPSDPVVRDLSGFDQHGTLTGAQQGQASGKIGLALRVTSGSLVVPASSWLRPRPRVSVSVWVNLDTGFASMVGAPVLVDKTGGAAAGYFLGCLTPASADISFRVHNSAGTPYTATYTEAATTGWVHYVGVYEGMTVRLYRNGVAVATAVSDGSLLQNESDLVMGDNLEGLLDEVSIWRRMLTAGEVTSLYNAGNALLLHHPELFAGEPPTGRAPGAPFSAFIEPYAEVVIGMTELAAEIADDCVPVMIAHATMGAPIPMSMVPSPYMVVDSPRRIFIDPNPVILNVEVNAAHHITATANAGPTDASSVATWWQIELTAGVVVIVADLQAGLTFQVNHNQTDEWDIPLGQAWNGKVVRFYMQAVDDAAQMWHSNPWTLTDFNFNNVEGMNPAPLPPGPPLGPERGPVRGVPGPGIYRGRTLDFSRSRRR